MNIKHFKNEDLSLEYFIGLASIRLESNDLRLNELLDIVDKVQFQYKNSTIQFFNPEKVLNVEHVYNACYFSEKAFKLKFNISSKKNLEYLLYLSGKRQIKNALEDFGLNDEIINKKSIECLVISPINNIEKIIDILSINLHLAVENTSLLNKSLKKLITVKDYFEVSDEQLFSVLKTRDVNVKEGNLLNADINELYSALNDLICEKMVLLSLEKIKFNQ